MTDTPSPSPSELKRMREKSGSITDNRPLVTFLYKLMRDEVPPGRIEQLLLESGIDEPVGTPKTVSFTNGWLAQIAQDLAFRLTGWDHPWPTDDTDGVLTVNVPLSDEERDALAERWKKNYTEGNWSIEYLDE